MKTILITGATDGLGLQTATQLAAQGHRLLIHGRSQHKLQAALATVGHDAQALNADFSDLDQVAKMAEQVKSVDVLINNAGVLKAPKTVTKEGLDLRFVVNTLAPIYLTRLLLPKLAKDGRILNLSSAAQAPVNLDALKGRVNLTDFDAYSQSKLALTAWSMHLASELGEDGPWVVAINPGSMLATKMVREGFGSSGRDASVGVNLLIRAAVDPDFTAPSGQYFDNDQGQFGPAHPAAYDASRTAALMTTILELLPSGAN